MGLVIYERVGPNGRGPSPFSWCIRYALAHKGGWVEFRLVRFADVETVRGLSGQHMVPILCNGDRVIPDSWTTWGAETLGPVVRRLLRRWRDELARAFNGLGNRFPGHPASLA